jgi:hypothetical protein
MKQEFAILLVLLLVAEHANCDANYKKVVLTDPDALCLDGTQGAYYYREGFYKNKWILSFEGGGWCGSSEGLSESLEDCLDRSTNDWGSSAKYSDTWTQNEGILSDNPQNDYRDWSMAFLKYCDGTGHQGYKKDPILYKGKNLYFRGHNVTIGQFNSLNSLNQLFTAATDIMVTGLSAGGLAAFLWTNYVKDRAAASTRVISLPDSGIFLDSTNFVTKRNEYSLQFKNFMRFSNEEINPPTAECVAAYPNELWKCMFAEYNHVFIKVPLFAIQSPYDSWSLRNILGISCEDGGSLIGCDEGQMRYIEDYHTNTTVVLKAIAANSAKNGYWAPSCSNHVYSTWNGLYDAAYRIPANSVHSLIHDIVEWDQGLQVSYEHMDNGNWPINRPCSGLRNKLTSS